MVLRILPLKIVSGLSSRSASAIAILAVYTTAFSTGCDHQTTTPPSESLYQQGRLADCPLKPNCVSTQSTSTDHAIVPYTYSKSSSEAREALKKEMAKLPRTTLIKEDGSYFHYECRSAVMGLIDDVEFLFDEESKTLLFRSASRFGYSDWGANRKRMEDIRNRILGRI